MTVADPTSRPTHNGVVRVAARIADWPATWYVVATSLVLVAWQVFVTIGSTPDYVVPAPAQVLDALHTYDTVLLEQGRVTAQTILTAFAISTVLGIMLAIPIAFVRPVRLIASPLLAMSQAVPRIALAPLFIVWFGFGTRTNVIIAISIAVFPVIVNTTLGLMSLPADLAKLGRSMGGSRWRLFRLIRWPAAMPNVLAGMKVAITLAVIGAVVGEFIVGGAGLGYLTISASANQNTPLLFACVIALASLGMAFFGAVELLERIVLRHQPAESAR